MITGFEVGKSYRFVGLPKEMECRLTPTMSIMLDGVSRKCMVVSPCKTEALFDGMYDDFTGMLPFVWDDFLEYFEEAPE